MARVQAVQESAPRAWLDVLMQATEPSGVAAARLTRVARAGGVVVTSGQQPGLFGGPIYTWSKALVVRALADEIEAATGVPVAPVFWAATDDSDFAEASWTAVNLTGGFERLQMEQIDAPPPGLSMSAVPLSDLTVPLAGLERGCGSGADRRALDAVRRSYRAGATVGSAYVALLRELLEPLGITVLDAGHESLRSAAHPLLLRALTRADAVQTSLAERAAEIRAHGFETQVADVEELSLVFQSDGGRRTRVPRASAQSVASSCRSGSLSPNVLLRPVVERAVLPTVAYAAGPGEFAYFAQVSAVANALEAELPLAVPRWSVTLVEPHVDRLLTQYGLTIGGVANADALAKRLLQQAVPPPLAESVSAMREALRAQSQSLRRTLVAENALLSERTVDGIERAISWRLDRFDRRLRAAVRTRDTVLATDLGSLGGALFPQGIRQERMLNIIPFLVKYGLQVLEQMLEHARVHARGLVRPSA